MSPIGRYTFSRTPQGSGCLGGERSQRWLDDSDVVWSEVTGLCGFWDGSCLDDEGGRCADQTFCTDTGVAHDSPTNVGQNTLDAENGS